MRTEFWEQTRLQKKQKDVEIERIRTELLEQNRL